MSSAPLILGPDGRPVVSHASELAAAYRAVLTSRAVLIEAWGALMGLNPEAGNEQPPTEEVARAWRNTIANDIVVMVGKEPLEERFDCAIDDPEPDRPDDEDPDEDDEDDEDDEP